MKLFKAIAATAAAVTCCIGNPLPAEAFWGTGEGEATYQNLKRSDYMFNYKTQEKTYDSPGWILMTVSTKTGWVQKMKLVDCRGSQCMYFKRIADDSDKSVFVYELNCSDNTHRSRHVHSSKAHWGKWYKNYDGFEQAVAFNKFCR